MKFVRVTLLVLGVLCMLALLGGLLVYNTVGSEAIDSWKDPYTVAFLVFLMGGASGLVGLFIYLELEE